MTAQVPAERRLAPFTVSAVGLGCMNVSHAYGPPLSGEEGAALLLRALDLGVTHFAPRPCTASVSPVIVTTPRPRRKSTPIISPEGLSTLR